MFAPGLGGCKHTAPGADILGALRLLGLIPAIQIVLDPVPPNSELEDFPPWAAVALLWLVRVEMSLRKLLVNRLVRGRVRTGLRSKPRMTVAKVRIRNIGIELFLSTGLEILFAMVIAVGTEDLAGKRLLSQPNGFPGRFGPL
jgi:hypothetical protein